MAEKTQKKVTKACNTCRLKRKKCDGLHPCSLCSENRIECLYSSEPKRRGPPSGYLRYMETRLALFEVLLGLFISVANSESTSERQNAAAATDPFTDIAQKLVDESKRCTQDVWDEHKRAWTTCRSAKIIDELALTFAPYNPRTEQEAPPKTLLPPRNLDGLTETLITPLHSSELPVSTSSAGPSAAAWSDRRPLPASISNLVHATGEYPLTTVPVFSREPFEADPIQPSSTSGLGPTEVPIWPCPLPSPQISRPPHDAAQNKEASGLSQTAALRPASSIDVDGMQADTVDSGDGNFLGKEGQDEGIIWRSSRHNKLDIQHLLSTTSSLELPPPRILSHIVDVYYNAVWQTFPLLPTRPTLETLMSTIPIHSDAFTTVLLALCAYCAHLSPLPDNEGEDGRAAANLWYQQARDGVRVCIKNGSSVEVAQALLLLAMTDYGQGNLSQAWFLTGLAIRVGQDMDLNGDSSSTYEQKNLPPPEIRLRRNIWRVSLMLDLFLSLHLGRAPALFDGLQSATKYDVQQSEYAIHPVPTFLHTVALCQTISRIYLHLYLACNTPGLQTPAEKLTVLGEELESWHRSLPAHYSVAVGNQSEKLDVLELNMLYQVAVILLHHPFCLENAMACAIDALIEAAAVFDELLRRYRPVQKQMLQSSTQPPLLPNPNLIYYIFTAAFAHLSGYKMLCPQSSVQGVSVVLSTERFVLQTRTRLSLCLDALASTGKAWTLAQRLGNSLNKLMEGNGLRDKATTPEFVKSTLGKRIWEDDAVKDAEEAVYGEGGSISVVVSATRQNPRPVPVNWGGRSLVRPCNSQSTPGGLSPKRFNVAAFPSVQWLTEDCESKSASHTRIWNGVWDI